MGPYPLTDFVRTTKRMTDAEVEKIETAMTKCQGDMFKRTTTTGARNMAVLYFLLFTGCRAVSITHLRMKDLDWRPDGSLIVNLKMKRHPVKKFEWVEIGPENDYKSWKKSLQYKKDGVRTDTIGGMFVYGKPLPPVNKPPKVVPASISAEDAATLIPLFKKLGVNRGPNDPVFNALTTAGKPIKGKAITSPAVQFLVKEFGEKVGIDHLRSHTFRHTLASQSAEAGAGLHDLMAQFGWSSFAMAQTYIDYQKPINLRQKVKGK